MIYFLTMFALIGVCIIVAPVVFDFAGKALTFVLDILANTLYRLMMTISIILIAICCIGILDFLISHLDINALKTIVFYPVVAISAVILLRAIFTLCLKYRIVSFQNKVAPLSDEEKRMEAERIRVKAFLKTLNAKIST